MDKYDMLYCHLLLVVLFFIFYCALWNYDNNNFKNATCYSDLLYFTTTTQSSTGYGDIVPNTFIAKMTVVLQQIACIFLFSSVVIGISEYFKK
jgi:heme A synthase